MRKGGAAATAETPEGLAALCIELLSNGMRLEKMSKAAKALGIGNSAAALYERIHRN